MKDKSKDAKSTEVHDKDPKSNPKAKDTTVNLIVIDAAEIKKPVITYDPGANHHVFGDISILSEHRKGQLVSVKGYNGDTIACDDYYQFGTIGIVLYVEGINNLLSQSQLIRDGFEVNFNSKDNTFTVSREGVIVLSCPQNSNGLCTTLAEQVVMAWTMTKEAVSRAKLCQEMHEAMGHIGDTTLMAMLRNGSILNTPLVAGDVPKAREHNGPCRGCLKGKMTHAVAIPSQNATESKVGGLLHMDIVFFHEEQYLISVDDLSKHVILIPLPSKRQSSVEDGIGKIVNIYTGYQHQVKKIRTDSEAVFISCDDYIRSLGILPQLVPPEHHEASIERCVRQIKDKTRALIFGLKYTMPDSLYKFAIKHAVTCINMTTTSDASGETPNQLVCGSKLNAKSDLRASFGDIGLFRIPYANKNDDEPRAELGIVVGRVGNSNGILKVYVPTRNRVVSRFKFMKTEDVKDMSSMLE
jgi:hypothetical protein